jgi:hypothetical protein
MPPKQQPPEQQEPPEKKPKIDVQKKPSEMTKIEFDQFVMSLPLFLTPEGKKEREVSIV